MSDSEPEVERVANFKEVLDSKPAIPEVNSFVELIHWLRQIRISKERPCDCGKLFETLERLGIKDAERRFVAQYGYFDGIPAGVSWIECCTDDDDDESDERAALHAEHECEEMLRSKEFPLSWSVSGNWEWPSHPILVARDLAAHLRRQAAEFSQFALASDAWQVSAELLLNNATNALILDFQLAGCPRMVLATTPHGFARQLAELAEWIEGRCRVEPTFSDSSGSERGKRRGRKPKHYPHDTEINLRWSRRPEGMSKKALAEDMGLPYATIADAIRRESDRCRRSAGK